MKILGFILVLFACLSSLAADVNITNATRADSVPSGSYALGTTGLVTRLLPINLMSVANAATSTSNLVANTSSAAVYFTLPAPGSTPYTVIKTNAAYNLYVNYSTTTNVISGDGVWVECVPISGAWFVRW